MIKKYQKQILLLGLILLTLGCGNFTSSVDTKNPTEKLPILTLSILIEENQREELFMQLQKFSEKHQLKFYLDFYAGKEGNQIFSFVLYGDKFHISALSKPVSTTELDINFYEEDPNNPLSQEVVDELYNDLKSFIREIEGVVILEE